MLPCTHANAMSTNCSGHVHKKLPPVPRKCALSNTGDQANKCQKQKHQDAPDKLTPNDEDDGEPEESKTTTKPRGGKEEGGKKKAGKKKTATKRVKKPRCAPPPLPVKRY